VESVRNNQFRIGNGNFDVIKICKYKIKHIPVMYRTRELSKSLWRMRPGKSRVALLADRKTSCLFQFDVNFTGNTLYHWKTNKWITILRTAEQQKATNTYEKYLCTKDQCSPLRNRAVTHAHITCLPDRLCHKHFLNCRVQHSGAALLKSEKTCDVWIISPLILV
jgi:hypothetical protein